MVDARAMVLLELQPSPLRAIDRERMRQRRFGSRRHVAAPGVRMSAATHDGTVPRYFLEGVRVSSKAPWPREHVPAETLRFLVEEPVSAADRPAAATRRTRCGGGPSRA